MGERSSCKMVNSLDLIAKDLERVRALLVKARFWETKLKFLYEDAKLDVETLLMQEQSLLSLGRQVAQERK